MQKLEVIPGTEYGDLKVIKEVESKSKRHFLCQCSCGQRTTVRLGHLTSGHSTTCGMCGIKYQGQRKSIRQWAKMYGLNESTLRARLKLMDIGEALKRG
jgi:transcription elongation factor Elf1